MAHIILGLGSNIPKREAYLQRAISALEATALKNLRSSAVYENAAMLPADAPKEWDMPFLNMAVIGVTELSPEALLDRIKEIESVVGRKERAVWAPREIDIDILAYDDRVIHSPWLHIPHPGLSSRAFMVKPFAELAPNWQLPVEGDEHSTAMELTKRMDTSQLTKIVNHIDEFKESHVYNIA